MVIESSECHHITRDGEESIPNLPSLSGNYHGCDYETSNDIFHLNCSIKREYTKELCGSHFIYNNNFVTERMKGLSSNMEHFVDRSSMCDSITQMSYRQFYDEDIDKSLQEQQHQLDWRQTQEEEKQQQQWLWDHHHHNHHQQEHQNHHHHHHYQQQQLQGGESDQHSSACSLLLDTKSDLAESSTLSQPTKPVLLTFQPNLATDGAERQSQNVDKNGTESFTTGTNINNSNKYNNNTMITIAKGQIGCRKEMGNESVGAKNSAWMPGRGHGGIMSPCVRLLVFSVCLFSFVGYSESRSLTPAEKRYHQLQSKTVKYLAQFGYLKGPSKETQNLRSQEDLTRAIKALQKAGGIPQTGVADSRTEALMVKPRCGNTDDFVEDYRPFTDDDVGQPYHYRKKRYTVATSKWPRTNLTFRFINYTPDMPQAKTRQLIGDALRVWSDATPLTFTEVRDSNADLMIMFASQYHSDGYPFDGKGMVLGHAFFPGHGKGGDTHFDDDENWTADSTEGVDLFMVAAHEFGHALGLAHSGDPSALMYPWYMGFEGKFQLPEDDLRGITSLYGSKEADRKLPERGGKVNLIPNSDTPSGRRPTYDITPTEPSEDEEEEGPADPCKSHIDALTVIRTEIFLFIGKYFWRLEQDREISKPTEIHQFWYGLPKHLDKIDAVFERPDNKIVFFSGDRYWIFNANRLINGFPTEGRPITEFNIPADVKKIDAAFVWGYNKRTYLVSGDMYWKMNENNTFVEYDYPRDMGTWNGVPVPLDSAFKDWSGKTFFFQGLDYWEFYDMRMRVRRGYPKRISNRWLNCPQSAQRVEQRPGADVQAYPMDSNSNARLAAEDDKSEKKKSDNNNSSPLQFSGVLLIMVFFIHKVFIQINV